ncbi:hypothetical protein HPB50_006524 [Hyalomma asiaticum]|uniref:Uncharacterized protein n=1 Tax=Hyalomma asiaticum TaxID=266040 RepID=A0ACB7RV26_HYAAI|nr:hypothetical protein HPB50_006524 [Hyalomma asiaticum]
MATQVSVVRVNASNETTDTVLRKFWELEAIGIMTEDNTVPKLIASVQEDFHRKLAFVDDRYEVPVERRRGNL